MNTAKNFNLDDRQVSEAAAALANAVSDYLEATKTGKGRKTASGFADVVRRSLGRQRVSKSLFALVLNRSVQMGLVEVARSESGRTYLQRPSNPEAELEQEDSPVRVSSQPAEAVQPHQGSKDATPPKGPPPPGFRCSHCECEATRCVHCQEPPWDDDIYVDSRGRWRCGACNDLAFTESWGGYLRWKLEQKGEE